VLSEEERATLVARANTIPAVHSVGIEHVYHFSEDGTIRRFAPHVPPTNPSHPAAVWAIDESHSPLYWFPRNCPRISVWADTAEQQAQLTDTFETEASRLCAAETHWIEGVQRTRLYRYVFDAGEFRAWREADGQYIADDAVYPQRVEPIDDLLGLFAASQVELRFTPRLGALMDRILQSGLPFSFVRIRDARR
jgi:hypothetical protein